MTALPDCPGLTLVQEGECLLARLTPVAERAPLDADGLKALIEQSGYGRWIVSVAGTAQLLECCSDPAAELSIELAKSSEASFSIEVATDAMQAWVNVVPACGGKPLQADDVFMALGEAGVTYGIDPEAVSAA